MLRFTMISESRRVSSARLATRLPLVAKRASSASSGRPATSQNLRNRLSLPQATITLPSAVFSTWYGAMFGWSLPRRPGGVPVAR